MQRPARAFLLLPLGVVLAACKDEAPVPRIDAVDPGLTCAADGDETVRVRIAGQDLGPTVADALTGEPRLVVPKVGLTRSADAAGERFDAVQSTLVLGDGRVVVVDGDTLELVLDPGLGLAPGWYDVEVRGADDAVATLPDGLAIAGAPELEAVDPAGVCTDAGQSVSLALTGTGLLDVDGALPTLTLDDGEQAAVAVADCVEIPSAPGSRTCRTALFDVDPGGLPVGTLALGLRNAAPLDCDDALPLALDVAPAPIIDEVLPAQACTTGATFTITGEHFVDGTEVSIGGVLVEDVEILDRRTIEVTLGGEELGAGSWDVVLSTPGGCEAIAEAGLTLSLPPLVFAVDPPVVPTGLPLQVTAQVSDVFDEVTEVWLEDPGGDRSPAEWTWDPELPGEVLVALPDDLAEGDWGIVVDQGAACPGQDGATFTVRSDHDLAIDRMDPSFAWTYDWTPVEIIAPDPLPTDAVPYAQGVRAWVVDPTGAGGSHPLHSLTWQEEDRLSAVVPYGLGLGTWDLLLVDPLGRSGHLVGALTVVEDAPPAIESVTPGTLPNSSDQDVIIRGRDFRDPTVSLTCREDGAERSYDVTVDTWTASRIDATVPTTTIGEAVCVVAVENSDGTDARYSAISVTNPAQNLFPWQAGTDMNVARRAPGAAAGRSTGTSRWLWAIGGDDGDPAGAYDSVEVAGVGVYGDMAAWRVLSRTLPEPRTLAAVTTIGRFVYVVGGHDGSTPVATTWRAMILDPLDVPWFDGLSLASDETGLSAGQWTWRVSAVYADDDAANPGGEGLAGDPIQVTLPDGDALWRPTLRWRAVDGAVAYRIYRSAEAGAAPGEEELVEEITAPADVEDIVSWTDTGDATDAAVLPLFEGALGAWAELSELSTPRESPCLVAAPDPFPDPEIVYLYAAGGTDDGGDVLGTIERLAVVVEGPRLHSAGEWEVVEAELSEARTRCGAMVVDESGHTVVEEDEVRVYFAGGVTERRSTGTVDTFVVEIDGELVDGDTIDSMSPARAGFAAASASNFLYAFGGQNDGPSTGGVSGELEPDLYPDLRNWNSLGTSLSEARWLPGGAQESAVIFVVGGATDTADATSSTDWTSY